MLVSDVVARDVDFGMICVAIQSKGVWHRQVFPESLMGLLQGLYRIATEAACEGPSENEAWPSQGDRLRPTGGPIIQAVGDRRIELNQYSGQHNV
jgi:hypothetical protein